MPLLCYRFGPFLSFVYNKVVERCVWVTCIFYNAATMIDSYLTVTMQACYYFMNKSGPRFSLLYEVVKLKFVTRQSLCRQFVHYLWPLVKYRQSENKPQITRISTVNILVGRDKRDEGMRATYKTSHF